MLSFLAALTIGVVGMSLYPFEHEPIFKVVKKYEEPTESWFYPAQDNKVCFEPKNKKE